MNIILFGASGMVGQGVLRECLLANDVDKVLVVGRSATGQTHPKLTELAHRDFTDFTPVAAALTGYDACFFCLGVSAGGMSEAGYTAVTEGYTLAAAKTILEVNPGSTFIYVSGTGTDSTAKGSTMWARVKGRTENALQAMPFGATFMFRPGLIRPMHGAVSKTKSYRVLYTLLGPVLPVLQKLMPGSMTTTEAVGRAMLQAARGKATQKILENTDISALAATSM
jgi:uncharacterized protein YbjT (DUF2867 family)